MKVLGKIIAVLYSIIFVFALTGVSLLIGASNLLDGSFYTEVLKSVDLNEINASDLGLTDNPDESLQDVLVNQLSESGLDKQVSEAILNNEEIKEVVGDVIGQVIDYTAGIGEAPKVTTEQAKVILNNKNVKQLLDEDLTDEDINELVNGLNEFLKEFADEGGSDGNE